MSCSGSFDIKQGDYSECPSSEVCGYNYSYEYDRTSKCKVTKKERYLKLVSWDRSDVTVANMKNLSLTEARLYAPSVNKWNGSQADAELILSHSGSGKSVDVCIPITENDSSGDPSIGFFDAIDNAVKLFPGESNGSMRQVELPANFSLEQVIPKTSFYLAEGDGMGILNCNPTFRNIIIFSNDKPMKIKGEVLSRIKNIINPHNINNSRTITGSKSKNGDGGGQFWKNTTGTTKGNSDKFSQAGQMAMECEPVNNSNTGNNVGIKKNPTVDAADTFSGMDGEEILHKYVVPVLIFIGAILGIYLGYQVLAVFKYPHYDLEKNEKGKKVNRLMYAVGHIPWLGRQITGKDGLSRMKGETGDEEE